MADIKSSHITERERNPDNDNINKTGIHIDTSEYKQILLNNFPTFSGNKFKLIKYYIRTRELSGLGFNVLFSKFSSIQY